MDEDADVDTAAEEGAPERPEEEEVPPTTTTEVQSQEDNQLSDTGQGQTQSSNTSGIRPAGVSKWIFLSEWIICLLTVYFRASNIVFSRARQ